MDALDERAKRIVDTAVALAEREGFAAVRLRDVAATANVALGTVYKRFSSKEEILIAALEQESEKISDRLGKQAIPGETPGERAKNLFTQFTRGMCRRPNLTKALVRAIASGDPNITGRVASFHAMLTGLTIAAMRGTPANSPVTWADGVERDEREIASILQQVWFSALVGWAGGIHDQDMIITYVNAAADRLL
ncbi:MAG: TetR/AcrR family transcriptional regulator [Sandaracinaceae bacterium]|nr:TetR/AcrR family transcriptional regulator [Sandaracinaceae bacterium]